MASWKDSEFFGVVAWSRRRVGNLFVIGCLLLGKRGMAEVESPLTNNFQLNLIVIAVHAGIDEAIGSHEALVDEAAEVVVPLDVAGAADDVFERAGSAIVVGDGAGDGVVVVLKELVGEDAALDAIEKALGVDEDEDFREAAENGGVAFPGIEFEDPADGLDGSRRMQC